MSTKEDVGEMFFRCDSCGTDSPRVRVHRSYSHTYDDSRKKARKAGWLLELPDRRSLPKPVSHDFCSGCTER